MNGTGWAASAMISSRTRLEIATDNLANASSDGFRKQLAHGFLSESGAHVEPLASDVQGALRRTGRPFDLAIVGRGHFLVVDPHGALIQTRSGAFTRDRFGALRDDAGRALLGTRGIARVPDGARIEKNGAITKDGIVLERIPLQGQSSVQTGFIEGSNVNAISEMVDMLGAQRSFESAQKVLSAIDAANQKVSNEIARLK